MRKKLNFLMLAVMAAVSVASLSSCDFFSDGDLTQGTQVSSLRLTSSSQTIKVGEIAYITLAVTPQDAKFTPSWSYDTTVLNLTQNGGGAVIKGMKEGQSAVTCSAGGKSATIIIKVSGFTETYEQDLEPYIYSDTQIVNLSPSDTETIHVSLYNGTAADIDGYTWSIDKASIAVLEPTGQYCKIRAKDTGYARIKVTHSKASYPYYIGLYVMEDFSKSTYITTKQNVVSLKTSGGDQTITAEVTNPKSETWKYKFTWSILENPDAIDITANAEQCVITPCRAGVSTIRIENDECPYPLDITVRVIEIVDSVYIEPSVPHIEISGDERQEVSATLRSTAKTLISGVDYSDEDFEFVIDDESILTSYSFGNRITMQGLHNGLTTLRIRHPQAKYERQILVVVQDQAADAVDSSVYITTSQNYIKTKVGAEETLLNVSLRGGVQGDENGFTWEVKQSPKTTGQKVVEVETANGTVNSRSAALTFAGGTARIRPVSEGTATITVRHPKSYFPTEILVSVLDKDAVLDSPLYFQGESIVRFLNSATYDYRVTLQGDDRRTGDENLIRWESDSEVLHISSAGESAVLSSTATGGHISHLTISHPRAADPKSVLVLTADTQKELNELKGFYSDKTHYGINVGQECIILTESVGFDTPLKAFDFSAATWVSSNPQVASVEKSEDNPLMATVHGISSGKTEITCSYINTASITYTVTVYPEGVNIGIVESARYITTGQNVVNMARTGATREVSVTAVGISGAELSEIQWKSENETIATVIGNGDRATVTAAAEGETVLTVTHPKSENTLKIYVRVGSEYVTQKNALSYISTNTDTVLLLKDDPTYTLTAHVSNGSEEDSLTGFDFAMEDEAVAKISASYQNGKCYIKPISAGQTELTVTHSSCLYPKKLLVVVANTAEELAAFRYLSTSTNVITVGEGQSRTVTVSMMNSADAVLDGYSWTSDDPTVVSVSAQTGSQAVIKGNRTGATKVRVTNSYCQYPLEMIVQVVDANTAAEHPYIQVNSPVVTLTTSTAWTNLTAELVGGTDSDLREFEWEVADSSIVQCYGQNGVGKIRGVTKGQTYITVSHRKAEYPQRILCIVDESANKNCSISVSCGNIMSIKPSSGDTTISAQLINGEAVDKYNFTWSLDVYDIVDLNFNADTAIITPVKEGTCTITVHHPKSAYDQKIYVKVQKYDNFGFGTSSMKIREGSTSFVSMQVPASSVKTTVKYSTNAENVVQVSGTDAVCQLTGTGHGTAVIHAELVAVATGIVQSEADLLVYSEKTAADEIYITGSTTVYSIEKGKRKTLAATLVGKDVSETDQRNLEWTSSDPSVLKIEGASTSGTYVGSECYVSAVAGGDCTVTIRHDKADTPLVYHIIVPQEQAAEVTLNKSYAKITQGNSFDLTASITNGKNEDYKTLVWEIDKPNGVEVARILGSGKTVNIYAINAGTTHVRCSLPDTGDWAECEVIVEAMRDLQLDTTIVRVRPTGTREVGYTVTPDGAILQWKLLTQTGDEYISVRDQGHNDGKGSLLIEGIKEGTTTVTGISNYGNTVTLTVYCSWDYKFQPDRKVLRGTPAETFTISYQINPPDASVSFDAGGTECKLATLNAVNNGDGTGTITVKPKKEGKDTINVVAKNGNTVFGEFTLDMNFEYDHLTPIIDLRECDGKFSRYDAYSGILYIGDGEKCKMSVNVANEGVEWELEDFKIVPLGSTATNKSSIDPNYSNVFYIENPKDIQVYEYFIKEWYDPFATFTAPGDISKTATKQGLLDPKRDFYWVAGHDGWAIFGTRPYLNTRIYGTAIRSNKKSDGTTETTSQSYSLNAGMWGTTASSGWSIQRKRDPSRDGTIMSVSEYEGTPWYWRPYFPAYKYYCLFNGYQGTVFCDAASARQTGNQPAVKRVTLDTSVVSQTPTERIEFYINHNNRSEKFSITVVTEKRNCTKTCEVVTEEQEVGGEDETELEYEGSYGFYPFSKRNPLGDTMEWTDEFDETHNTPVSGEGWYVFTAVGKNDSMDFYLMNFDGEGTGRKIGGIMSGKYEDMEEVLQGTVDWTDVLLFKEKGIPFKYWCLLDDAELLYARQTFPDLELPETD